MAKREFTASSTEELFKIDMDDVIERIRDVEQDADDAGGALALAMVQTVGDQICKPIRETSPVDTGRLRGSTYLKPPEKSGGSFVIQFGQGVDYAASRFFMDQKGKNERSRADWFIHGMYENSTTFEVKLAIRYFRNLKRNASLNKIDPRWHPSNKKNPFTG